jgi:hypothetical protein
MKLIMETWNRFLKEQTEDSPFEVGDVVEDPNEKTKGEILSVAKYYDKEDSYSGKDEYGYIMKIIASEEEELVGTELEFDPSVLIDYDFTKVG